MPTGSNVAAQHRISSISPMGEEVHRGSETAPRLVVFGAGGHARCVADAALRSGWTVSAFVDEFAPGGHLLGIPVLAALPREHVAVGGHVVIGVGDNSARQSVTERLDTEFPGIRWGTVVAASVDISDFADVGQGAVVLAGAVIGPGCRLADGVLVSTAGVVTHDCRLAPYSSVGPGAILGGMASVGRRSAVGAGATIREKTGVGSDSVVGAGAYVAQDVPDGVVSFGVPARVVRSRGRGDRYLL